MEKFVRNDPFRLQASGILVALLLSLVAALAAPAPDSATEHYVVITNTAKSYQIDLQAMLNDAPHATNRRYAGGVNIELGAGVFYTGGAMWTNKYGVDSITIKGQGGVQTCLVFTNNSGLDFSGAGSFNGIGVNLQGLLIASTVDSNYFLVRIANNSRSIIDDVTFHYWPSATNNGNSGLQIPLGLRTPSANGLCGLWYDGLGNFGDAFIVQDCNFDSLVVGAVISGNHARLYNNFFEGTNRGGGIVGQAANTWPANDALHLGGALFFGRNIDKTALQSFAAVGNHWFNCSNAIVDLRSTDDGPLGELRFIDSQFEFGQSVLMLVNSSHRLFFDGVSYSPPLVRNFTADLVPMDGNTGQNPNFRVRTSDHFSGSWQFDSLSSANFSGNGAGLTNLAATANPTSTAPFFITTNLAHIGVMDLRARFDSLTHFTGQAAGFGGGKIQINGLYYVGTNFFDMTNDFSFELCGSSEAQSGLIITNWDGGTPALKFFSSLGNNPWRAHIHDLLIAVTSDRTNCILKIDKFAKIDLERLQIGLWAVATNANGEAGGSFATARNTIGLEVDTGMDLANGQEATYRSINLFGNHLGAILAADHNYVDTMFVESCGQNNSTDWSKNDLRSVGGGLLFISSGFGDDTIIGLHSYSTPWPVINAMTNQNAGLRFFGGDFGEASARSLTAQGASATLAFIHQKAWGGRSAHDDKTLVFTNNQWAIFNDTPDNVVDEYSAYGQSMTRIGGAMVFSADRGGIISSNIAAATIGAVAYTGPATLVIDITGSDRGTFDGHYTNTSDGYFRDGSHPNGIYFEPSLGTTGTWVLVPTNNFGHYADAPLNYQQPTADYPFFVGVWNAGVDTANGKIRHLYNSAARFPNGISGDASSLTNIHYIKSITGTGFTVGFTPNADGSSNATITLKGGGGFSYGGTPTIVTNAPGLLTGARFIGKPFDGAMLLTFSTSATTQVALTNLLTINLSAATSTNFVIPTCSQAAWGTFNNTDSASSAPSTKFWLVPNPASPSNSFLVQVSAPPSNTPGTYTLAIHVDRP